LAGAELSATANLPDTISEEEVRIHAYLLYERRGGSEDHAVEDWLTAEAHVWARRNRANKAIAT